jgi:alpha-galactosidase
MNLIRSLAATCIAGVLALGANAQEKSAARPELKRPDGQAADQSKKVKVFVLMGQSNMVGMGDIAGGSTAWRTVLRELELSVYNGAFSADTDYDKATPVLKVALTNVNDVAALPGTPAKCTYVLRGKIQMPSAQLVEWSPGYHTPNIMVVDGTEVYREEPGKKITTKSFKFEAGKAYQFKVTYLDKPSNSGWYTRMDVPGSLHTFVKIDKRYPYLLDDAGDWAARKDVYYYDAREKHGAPLGALANNGKSIGPEVGFGYVLGQLLDEPVLVLKSCIGNRGLGWDLLPPGSKRFEAEVTERDGKKVKKVFAGYQDKPDSWVMDPAKGLDTPPPPFVDKAGKPIDWYAGKQYDIDIANAKAALADLAKIYPDYKGQGFEVAGFVYWQGHKDQSEVYAARYEYNLTQLIPALRKDFDSPNAKFVIATGCGNPGRESFGLQIAEAQLAIGDAKKHPEFAGTVKSVDQRDLWREANVSPKEQGFHYNRNAETYLETGVRLGWAMADLLNAAK